MQDITIDHLTQEMSDAATSYLSTRNQFYKKGKRHFTRKEAGVYLNVNSKTIDRYVKKFGFDPKKYEDAAWLITIDEIYQIREALVNSPLKGKKFTRKSNQKLQVIAIQNQKGGVGKTVTATTLASGLAIEFHEQFRVGLIDLDPQQTATSYYPPTMIDENGETELITDYWSVGDIFKKEYELGENDTFKSFVSEAFVPTTIPNLRILPASQRDRGVETSFHRMISNGELQSPYTELAKIIKAVEDEFDIIVIDTPPSTSFATLNAYFAATSVIFPMQLDQNDIDATCGYLKIFDEVEYICKKNGHPGWDFRKLLFTNYKSMSSSSTLLLNDFNMFFDKYSYQISFNNSEAIKECTRSLNTIFDISKSEYTGRSKLVFETSKINAFSVISQIYRDIIKVWNLGELND